MKYILLIPAIVLLIGMNSKKHLDYSCDVYVQETNSVNKNYLILKKSNNLVAGVFLGVDYLNDSTVFYYKSTLDNLKITENKIKFTLNKFALSSKPFLNSNNNKDDIDRSKLINLTLEVPHYFLGTIDSSRLDMSRVVAFYDSRADAMKFKKTNCCSLLAQACSQNPR